MLVANPRAAQPFVRRLETLGRLLVLLVVQANLPQCVAELMGGRKAGLLEHCPLASKTQLGGADIGLRLPPPERDREVRAKLPIGIGIGIHLAKRAAKIFAEAVHAVESFKVELRQETVL